MTVSIQVLKDKPRYLKALIYGEPGAGKTYLVGTAPKPLFVDVEGGTMTIRDRDIAVVKVTSWEDLEEVLDNLEAKTKGWEKYESLCLDSITEVQTLLHEQLLKEGAANSSRSRDPDVMEMQDWGKSLVRMQRVMRRFRDLPMHVFMTSLSEEGLDNAKQLRVRPALQGRMAMLLPAIMDVVGYLYTETDAEDELHRMLLVQQMGKYIAKDRTGNLGTVIQDPTAEGLIAGLSPKKEESK